MIELFKEQPLLLQWVPSLNHGLVIGIGRVGQILILTAALMGLFQTDLVAMISSFLHRVAIVIRKFSAGMGWRWDKDEVGFQFPPSNLTTERIYEDIEIKKQFVLSSILLFILLSITGRGPLGWLVFPFEMVWRGITVWFEVHLTFWSILGTVIGSLGRFVGFMPLFFLSILACAIIVKPYAFLLSKIAELVSIWFYRLTIVLVLVTGSLLVLIA